MDLKKDGQRLYDDIDACIGSLVSGLLRKDEAKVDEAMQNAGTLMVRTMQFLRCFLDESSSNTLNKNT